MFPPETTNERSARSWRELFREAVGTALEFATLGEATVPARPLRPAPGAPTVEHTHGRSSGLRRRPRRPGMVPAAAQVCSTPLSPRAARSD